MKVFLHDALNGIAIRGRPPRCSSKCDPRVSDNMDGARPKFVTLMIHQAPRVDQVLNRFVCGHHGRNVLANERGP
eukprot:1443457-Pyramimonas_sp.AAC.1